ncbi:DUF6705 family protein [Flavobacterium suncheonense]|uniref:DUF6705 domain-containing protein n=1 Tax=Flavobacterium suncheonense GH29-5 = DSM 17707 TaxID=1121899 RepID=A0A0A2LX96_9FLAO|nr:DUF6705 family protein [Flavobacterium suncheonense]KGO84609.1 hypothetical protein Q764_14410 [Flavobacterium suncheonense GH29-5 = DSM 17707]
MKNIFNITVLLLFFSCKAQTIVDISTYNQGDNSNKYFKDINNNYQNFIGTWENTNDNITFRLILWKETMVQNFADNNTFMDELKGRFLIIQNAGLPNEVILHNSVKYYSQNGYTTNSVITAFSSDGVSLGGTIDDNCSNGGVGILSGWLKMQIVNSGSTPLIANWSVKASRLLNGESFTVPTNVVLTKQ